MNGTGAEEIRCQPGAETAARVTLATATARRAPIQFPALQKSEVRSQKSEISESERWLRAQVEALCAVAVIEVERLETAMMASAGSEPAEPVVSRITDEEARRKLALVDAELIHALEAWRDRWMRWLPLVAVPLDIYTKTRAALERIEAAVKLVEE